MNTPKHLLLLTGLALGLLGPARALAEPAAAPDEPWGAAKMGLQCQLLPAGAFKVGEKFRFQLALRNAGGESVNLGEPKKAFVWFMIGLGGQRAIFTEKAFALGGLKSQWAEGGKKIDLGEVDATGLAAYDSQAGMKVQGGYIAGELPKSAGTLGHVLQPGAIKARALIYLVRGEDAPVMLVSNTADILVQPPQLSSLSPQDRAEFVKQLIAKFDKDAWAGQAAHREAVGMGKEVVGDLLEALSKLDRRPPHSQMWLTTALCDIACPEAVKGLQGLLAGPVSGITHVVAYHGPKQRDEALDKAIVAKVLGGKDSRMTALAILGFLGARGSVPEEVLKAGLDSDDPRVRAEVVRAFSQTADPDSVRRVAALLADKNERVRMTAARVLAGMNNNAPEVLTRLVAALDLEGEQARQAVCEALSALARKDMPYDPKAPAAQRAATIQAWKEWQAKRK